MAETEVLSVLLKELAIKSFENAEELYSEALLLYNNNKYQRAFFLTQIGVEEIGKHIICTSAFVKAITGDIDLKRFNNRFRNHHEKCSMLHFFEDTRFKFKKEILNLNHEKDSKDFNKLKMMSLYTDYHDMHPFKPSEIPFQEITLTNLQLLNKRIEYFKNTGVFDLLKNQDVNDSAFKNIIHNLFSLLEEFRKIDVENVCDESDEIIGE